MKCYQCNLLFLGNMWAGIKIILDKKPVCILLSFSIISYLTNFLYFLYSSWLGNRVLWMKVVSVFIFYQKFFFSKVLIQVYCGLLILNKFDSRKLRRRLLYFFNLSKKYNIINWIFCLWKVYKICSNWMIYFRN